MLGAIFKKWIMHCQFITDFIKKIIINKSTILASKLQDRGSRLHEEISFRSPGYKCWGTAQSCFGMLELPWKPQTARVGSRGLCWGEYSLLLLVNGVVRGSVVLLWLQIPLTSSCRSEGEWIQALVSLPDAQQKVKRRGSGTARISPQGLGLKPAETQTGVRSPCLEAGGGLARRGIYKEKRCHSSASSALQCSQTWLFFWLRKKKKKRQKALGLKKEKQAAFGMLTVRRGACH